MKEKIVILLFIVFISCSSEKEKMIQQNLESLKNCILFEETTTNKFEETTNEDYVADDIKIIKDFINKIPKIGPSYKEYLNPFTLENKEFFLFDIDYESDIGFNLKTLNNQYSGGYGNYYISILYYNSEVLKLNININFTSKSHRFIKDHIIQYIDFPVECYSDGIRYTVIFEKNINKYISENSFPLRLPINYSTIPIEYVESYKILIEPSINLSWGNYCGDGGQKTTAKIAIDNLTKNKQFKLVEDILYSSNVVGRIYALQSLEKWNANGEYKLSESAKSTIKKIKALDIEFYVCDFGCVLESMNFKQLSEIRPVDINVKPKRFY